MTGVDTGSRAAYARPTSVQDAVALREAWPQATVIAGGTDVMVAVNDGRRAVDRVIDLSYVAALADWDFDDAEVRIGATVPLNRVVAELGAQLPALAAAARLVGSPAIRHRATLGGNLATASPAGDTLLPMLAADATVELTSTRGVRAVAIDRFFVGPGRTVLAADELITGVRLTSATAEAFAKTGSRRAMVISVAAAAVRIDPTGRQVRIALGSVAPTPARSPAAEDFGHRGLDWSGGTDPGDRWWTELGELAATDTAPIDDLRGTSEHRRQAVAVLASRCARRAWRECTRGRAAC